MSGRARLNRRKMAILVEDSDFAIFKLAREFLTPFRSVPSASLGKTPSEVNAHFKLLAEFFVKKLKIPEERAQPFLHYWMYLLQAKDKGLANTNPVRCTARHPRMQC